MLETEQNLSPPASSASRFVSGEDLTVGTYITVSRAVIELPRFLFGCDFQGAPEVPVRWQHMPQDSGTPLKIKAVCLPYVYVEDVSECTRILDLRRCEVAALSDEFVSSVRQSHQQRSSELRKKLKAARKQRTRRRKRD